MFKKNEPAPGFITDDFLVMDPPERDLPEPENGSFYTDDDFPSEVLTPEQRAGLSVRNPLVSSAMALGVGSSTFLATGANLSVADDADDDEDDCGDDVCLAMPHDLEIMLRACLGV